MRRKNSSEDAFVPKTSLALAQKVFSKAAEGKRLQERRRKQLSIDALSANAFPFSRLPFDIQELILRYLPAKDIGMCCAVCKKWGQIYQGAVASIFAQVVGVARGRSRLVRQAELRLIHRLRNTHEKATAIEMALWAAFNGYEQYVVELVTKRTDLIDVNTHGSDDWDNAAVIHVACRQGNTKLLKRLLEINSEPVSLTKSKQTPLILACEYNFPEIADLLLRKCGRALNVNAQDVSGRTALYAACDKGFVEIVYKLLDWGDMIQQETGEAEPILDINLGTVEKGSPLCVACRAGQSRIVSRLLDSGAHVNATTEDGRTAFYCAVERGAINTTKLILEKRPRITFTDMAEILFEDRRREGMEAALQRAETETEIPNILPGNAGALIDFASSTGKTAVFVAAERGHHEMLQVLVDANANTNKPTFLNKTPLYAAAENGHTAVVKLLLEHSSREDVLHQTNFGTTAVFMAQRNGHLQIKNLLDEFCMDKLSREKAKRKKSKSVQSDAMNRLFLKKEKDRKKQDARATHQQFKLDEGVAEEDDSKASDENSERDTQKSRAIVESLTEQLSQLESAVNIAFESRIQGMPRVRPIARSVSKTSLMDEQKEQHAESGVQIEEEEKPESHDEEEERIPENNDDGEQNEQHGDTKDIRKARESFFAKKFGKSQQQEDESTASSLPSERQIPRKEKEMMAAKQWSSSFIDRESKEEKKCNGEIQLSSIKEALLNFSSLTSSYKMSREVFGKTFSHDEVTASRIEEIFEAMRNGKEEANAWDVFAGSVLSSTAPADEKLSFCFGLFDAKSRGCLDLKVAKTMLSCLQRSTSFLIGEPSRTNIDLDMLVDELAFINVQNSDFPRTEVEKEQFIEWAAHSLHGQSLLRRFL